MNKMFPAGRYWIGDPCYAIITGLMWQHHTAYGDGVYVDQDERRYGVDSGQLSIALAKNVDAGCGSDLRVKDLAHVVSFKAPFDVSYKNGVFKFGHIVIRT